MGDDTKVSAGKQFLEQVYALTPALFSLNILWTLLTIPVVTAFPAAVALSYATNQLAHGEEAGWGVMWHGFKQHLGRSYLWGLLNVFVVLVVYSNIWFYSHLEGDWTAWVQGLFLGLAFLWLLLQMYALPLLFEQERPHLGLALRNSLVLLGSHPLYGLGIMVLIIVIAIVTTVFLFPIWLLLSAGVIAYLANKATITSIARLNARSSGD